MSQILLVDDNAIQAATRKAILTKSGLRVVIAGGGEAALKMLAEDEFADQIALIITDHLMPGMNGPEFVRRLRERLPQTQVVVLSGLPDAEAEYGRNDVIFRLKPLIPDALIHLVNGLLDDSVAQTA